MISQGTDLSYEQATTLDKFEYAKRAGSAASNRFLSNQETVKDVSV